MNKKTRVLMILDGFGLRNEKEYNAVSAAATPNIDELMKNCPFVKLEASGRAVGLPEGQMGNSEVGHLNMGAGRIVYQDLTRITKSIEDGDFFENPELIRAVDNCIENGTTLHIYGLLSDGGVHSHNTHLYALLKLAKQKGLDRVLVHCFMDGRDTPPASGKGYIEELEEQMRNIGVGRIGVISGRYYAMDRDKRWERVKLAYDALTLSKGVNGGEDPAAAVQRSYDEGVTDEFILPTVMDIDGKPCPGIKDKDSIIFYDFRPDRAREITRAFCDPDFDGFERSSAPEVTYVCFTDYDETIPNKYVAFKKEEIVNTFGEFLGAQGLKQLRLAETEKYAHVTFFFNGGIETPNEGEERILVPSPKVATYDLQPEMSAPEVSEKLVQAIYSGDHDVIIINFANPDMVGHTGIFDAAVKAVETVDKGVGMAVKAIRETGGEMLICADHGNSEQMFDEKTNEPLTAHTTNPVPLILISPDEGLGLKEGGRLCDIVPTLIDMMGLEKPSEMTGTSLLTRD